MRDAGAAVAMVPKVSWPADLTEGVRRMRISRQRGNEPVRQSDVSLDGSGVWKMDAPFKGDADPDSVGALLFALKSPQVLRTATNGIVPDEAIPAFTILLDASGRENVVTTFQSPLGAPVPVRIDGVGEFLVAPTEFATKLPDPADFGAAGLWVSAAGKGTSLEVKGPTSYRMELSNGEWKVAGDRRKTIEDLEDVPGVITGRVAIDHRTDALSMLGLDKPVATAKLCVGSDCREFKFGRAKLNGTEHHFALAPQSTPVELHAPDWNLLVNGPFIGKKK
ncbi:MAG: hypothetical protein ACJ790_16765 [Myxococcaceae bacterium]